jgi:hypothetical protein
VLSGEVANINFVLIVKKFDNKEDETKNQLMLKVLDGISLQIS